MRCGVSEVAPCAAGSAEGRAMALLGREEGRAGLWRVRGGLEVLAVCIKRTVEVPVFSGATAACDLQRGGRGGGPGVMAAFGGAGVVVAA